MPAENRTQWIAILEAAAQNPPDEMNEEWTWLMGELGLPFDYYLAVCAAIQQGRWRRAKDPRAYVKTVAKREAVKLGLVSDELEPHLTLVNLRPANQNGIPRLEDKLGMIHHAATTSDLLKGADGVWRQGGGRESDYLADLDYEPPISRLPENLKVVVEPDQEQKEIFDKINAATDDHHWHLKSKVTPNWEEWGKLAGFDDWERLALKYMTGGKSREKALMDQPDEVSRKALQAAWKRFQRSGMERLRKAVKKNTAENVPEHS